MEDAFEATRVEVLRHGSLRTRLSGPDKERKGIYLGHQDTQPHKIRFNAIKGCGGLQRGAFTGAAQGKVGRLAHAGSGTVFLDEIGKFPIELQAKLLRVPQERQFQRVGGVRNIPLQFRIIAATNRNPEQGVDAGIFREDLYFRLEMISD